jgi:large subunit ribosomal protein L2
MSLISSKPTSSGVRHQIKLSKFDLTKNSKLITIKTKNFKRSFGRSNSTGHITSWHKGGGCKKTFSNIEFSNVSSSCVVISVIYDPFRNAFVNLNFDLENNYFFKTLAVENICPGSLLELNKSLSEYCLGFRTTIKRIPPGSLIHNISLKSKNLSNYIRAAGTYGQIVQCGSTTAKIKLPSGKIQLISTKAIATIGISSNSQSNLKVLGKAGKNRIRGNRPIVRGIAMNPVDHPHGGRTNGGKPSVTPWGLPTKCGFYLKKRKKNV